VMLHRKNIASNEVNTLVSYLISVRKLCGIRGKELDFFLFSLYLSVLKQRILHKKARHGLDYSKTLLG